MARLGVDCLIVGGGPARLTAAIYAPRFRLSVCLIDAGRGRAEQIPLPRNHARFPDGVSGAELVQRMRRQAEKWGAELRSGVVEQLVLRPDGFTASFAGGEITARAVLLATGVTNHRPAMSEAVHAEALAAGRLRYCPVCDGFEVIDQSVAVIGTSARGTKEALFLRSFTNRVTLVAPDSGHHLAAEERRALTDASVVVADGPIDAIALEQAGLRLTFGATDHLLGLRRPAPLSQRRHPAGLSKRIRIS